MAEIDIQKISLEGMTEAQLRIVILRLVQALQRLAEGHNEHDARLEAGGL